MHSKRYRWQTRWVLDRAASRATHVDGLIVSFAPDGCARAINAAAIGAELAPRHGHNVDAMLRRLVREAASLYRAQ